LLEILGNCVPAREVYGTVYGAVYSHKPENVRNVLRKQLISFLSKRYTSSINFSFARTKTDKKFAEVLRFSWHCLFYDGA